MTGSTSEASGGALNRSDLRRLREHTLEERARRLRERDALLESSLEPNERVLARRRRHPFVTDRRILDARRLGLPPRRGEWILDAVPFDDVTGWSLGERHDHRPILKVEHRARTTIDRVPARRFLWFTWGDAEGPVTRTTTSFGFGRKTNPVLAAMRAELERREIPAGPRFVIRPAGGRDQRIKPSQAAFSLASPATSLRFRLWRVTHHLYRGELAWPLRLLSWTLAAVPAWLVSPWLVVPAILTVELAWIVVMRWSGRRDRARSRDSI